MSPDAISHGGQGAHDGQVAHAEELHHQFESLDQQRESASFGMWLFIAQEALFFGGLFTAYAVYRWLYPESFAAASHTLNITLGFVNTVVLLTSSLTMALAVRGGQTGRSRLTVIFLLLTIALGLAFLGIKGFEYHEKFVEHHVPGPGFHFEGAGPRAVMFFNLYFMMTGLHALHMVIGIGLLAWVAKQAAKGRYTPGNHNFIEGAGLYWHFVDIIWIFLFPLLYLLGRHVHT